MHIAVFNGDLETTKRLVKRGADVNAKTCEEYTPLMIAVKCRHNSLIMFLLRMSAQTECINRDNRSAIMLAVESRNIFAIKALDAHGALLTTRNWSGKSLLALSVSSGSLRIFKYLRDRGLDPNDTDTWGKSAAYHAIMSTHFRAYLLNTDRSLDFGRSPINILSWAADKNNTILIRLLQRYMCDVPGILEFHKHGHLSPICAAARAGSIESVELLLNLGVDVEREGCEHGTALMTAGAFGKLNVVKMLVRRGARTQYTTEMGQSKSLFHAARGYPAIIKWLIFEQFVDQFKLCDGRKDDNDCAQEVKNWSGVRTIEYKLDPSLRRQWGESLFDFMIDIQKYKMWLRGTVVSIQRLPFSDVGG